MKTNNKYLQNLFYGFLFILFVYIICLAFNFQYSATNSIKKYAYEYELNNGYPKNFFTTNNVYEGFGNKTNKFENKDNTYEVIENKLRSLNEEIGGVKGKNEIKDILKNVKKIVNLECTKCMMSMINNKKEGRTINVEKIIINDEDDEDDENCIKCKRYTDLSNRIENLLNNL